MKAIAALALAGLLTSGAAQAAPHLVYVYQVKRITNKIDVVATGRALLPADPADGPAIDSGGANHTYTPVCQSAVLREACAKAQFDVGHVLTVRPLISPAHQLSTVRFSWRELLAMRTIPLGNTLAEQPELRSYELEGPYMLPEGKAVEITVYERTSPPARLVLQLMVMRMPN